MPAWQICKRDWPSDMQRVLAWPLVLGRYAGPVLREHLQQPIELLRHHGLHSLPREDLHARTLGLNERRHVLMLG